MSPEKFNERYEIISPGVAKSRGTPQYFIRIKENIKLETSWGELQFLKAGSALNVSNLNDIYGINKEEFEDTYRKLDKY